MCSTLWTGVLVWVCGLSIMVVLVEWCMLVYYGAKVGLVCEWLCVGVFVVCGVSWVNCVCWDVAK